MSDDNPGLRRLIDRPLRIPQYLAGTVEPLELLADPLAEVLTEFLRSKVNALLPETERVPSRPHDPQTEIVFDTHFIETGNSVRLTLVNEDVDTVVPILFGGPLSEQSLRSTVSKAMASKIAETVLMETGQGMGEPSLIAAGDEVVHPDPLLNVTYRFDAGAKGSFNVTIGYTRRFTDRMSAACDPLSNRELAKLDFTADAVLAEPRVPVDTIDAWQPGDLLPLPGASLEKILFRGTGRKQYHSFALGELGGSDGERCIRLTEVGDTLSVATGGYSGGAAGGAGSDDNALPDLDGGGELPDLPMASAYGDDDDGGLPDLPMASAYGDDEDDDEGGLPDLPMASAYDDDEDEADDGMPEMKSAYNE